MNLYCKINGKLQRYRTDSTDPAEAILLLKCHLNDLQLRVLAVIEM